MTDQELAPKKKKRGAPLGNTNAMLRSKSNITKTDLEKKRGAPRGMSTHSFMGFTRPGCRKDTPRVSTRSTRIPSGTRSNSCASSLASSPSTVPGG